MRVLVVSHNVFGKTGNMGKTLMNYFREFHTDDIAQFYIHSEVPTDQTVCKKYYRFTDKDALRSVFRVKDYGSVFEEQDIQTERPFSRTDTGMMRRAYQFGRKRTGSIYLARNIVWKCSHWFTKELKNWLTEFSPDIVFFASGDYAFMYDVARKIAEYLNKPLVVSCMDDYYVYSINEGSLIGQFEHRLYMRTVRRTMRAASAIVPICETMADVYSEMFSKPAYIMHTPAHYEKLHFESQTRQISYIGNLSFGRSKQLTVLGRALMELNDPEGPTAIDVYSGETDPEILAQMIPENGISFHGAVPSDEVLGIMEKSMAVIHTESFDEEIKNRVRFSVSTKIAESLTYGPCLLAYGPEGIASIDYLRTNDAAFVITEKDHLMEKLEEFLKNEKLRGQILQNARKLSAANHTVEVTSRALKEWLEQIAEREATDESLTD